MDEEIISHESSVNLFQAEKTITDKKCEHRKKKEKKKEFSLLGSLCHLNRTFY